MTRNELRRRIDTMTPDLAVRTHQMVLDGYGAAGIAFETVATRKQINAVFEWVNRYGRVVPQPNETP